MNPTTMAKTAYSAPGRPMRTARGTEYEIFARVTHRLNAAHALGAGGFATMTAALHDNRQLWSTLAADVADPGNGLPVPLRARIFYLAEFTRRHTSKVLAGKADVAALIDVNTAIMRGLKAEDAGARRESA